MMNEQEILNQIISAEYSAAELMRKARNIMPEQKSSRRDVVTKYDRLVQEHLTERFHTLIPAARFFCEEQDERDELTDKHVFVIDPIDGTMNFVHGFHQSCISVAYLSEGVTEVAAIYNPYTDQLFSAIRGSGAWLNNRPIHIDESPLRETIVCFGSTPYNEDLAHRCFTLAEKVFRASLDVRREGSAAMDLCSVAAGRAGLYFELQLSPWDYAAGKLIVQEAGGICRTIDGGKLLLDGEKHSIVCGSAANVEEFLKISASL